MQSQHNAMKIHGGHVHKKKHIVSAGVMPSKCPENLAVQFVKKNTKFLAKISTGAFWEAASFMWISESDKFQ